MLAECWDKLYPKVFKSPCKICLVRAACKSPEPWNRKSCEDKNKWRHRRYIGETFLNNVEVVLFGVTFILGCILAVITFFFGFWKWWDISKMLFS